jgi:hydrogenase expression/formation protein HypD
VLQNVKEELEAIAEWCSSMKSQLENPDVLKQIFRQNLPLALDLKKTIWKYANTIKEREKCDSIKIMNFCGTHEWTTTYYGLRNLLPPFLDLVAGPGCPVCVTPAYYVDVVMKLASKGVRIYTYGDSLRLRSVRSSYPSNLEEARANGGDVKVVYSFLDAAKDSADGKESVFLGIGFETTAPSYALVIKEGMVPENLKFLSTVRLTPPAMEYTIKFYQERGLLPIKGVIAPGHVSTITGAVEWEFLPREHGLPTVVAGFEPIDVLMAVAQILLMLKNNKAAIKIEYKRLVNWNGNTYAKGLIEKVFKKTRAAWRGIGFIPQSGLKLKGKFFKKYDALAHFGMPDLTPKEWKHDLPHKCRCGEVVVGIAKPIDCPLFMKDCSPTKPWGPCMVSFEGTCNVWARYGGRSSVLPEGRAGGG